MKKIPLEKYVSVFKSKAEFARLIGISRQNLNNWINDGYFVEDGWIQAPKYVVLAPEKPKRKRSPQ